MQVSFKFRDPLSAIGVNELLMPLKRVITEHEDVNAYVQRAGGLNKAILSVLSEKNFLRYSEGHVSACIQSTSLYILMSRMMCISGHCLYFRIFIGWSFPISY